MPLERYRRWKRFQPDVGCVFARYMANKPNEFGQRAVLINGHKASAVAAEIAIRVTEFIDDPTIVAGALVLPELTTLTRVVRVALALANRGEGAWKVTRAILRETPVGDVVAFNVVRRLPMTHSTCPSEALLLGPFNEFPNTRRAPVTALELFVGVPPTHKHSGESTKKVHLADVPIPLPAESVFNSMWERTVEARRKSLGGVNDERAKAKVTFSIPMSLATKLGCKP
jgi:hypothetical protein